MRWVLSLMLLMMFALFAACSSDQVDRPAAVQGNAAERITVYKSPT